MNRILKLALLFPLLLHIAIAQDTIDQQIKDYESKLANPNLPAELKPLIQARIDRLKQVKSLDLQIAAAKSLKSDLKDLTPDEIKKIDNSINALEQKKAQLMPASQTVAQPASALASTTAGSAQVASTPPAGIGVNLTTDALTAATKLAPVKTYARAVARALLVSKKPRDDWANTVDKLAVLTIAGAIDPDDVARLSGDTLNLLSKPLTDDRLKQIRVETETARTDKQIGASNLADGTTSLLDKPGIPSLLGFALEHGAIDKQVNGTTLTLTTSPYAVIAAFGGGDTQSNYMAYAPYRRVGFSATFDVQNSNNTDPTTVSRKQLDEWSAKLRLTPDRSTRSSAFQKLWETNFHNIADSVAAEGPVYNQLLVAVAPDATPTLTKLEGDSDWIQGAIQENQGLPADQQEQQLSVKVLEHMQAAVAQLSDKTIMVSKDQIAGIVKNWLLAQQQHLQGVKDFETLAKDFSRKFNATVSYINKRQVTLSDYSIVKVLLNKHVAGQLIFSVDTGVSLYHHPNPTLNQETFRDFTTAFSFEKPWGRSPFVAAVNDNNPITASLSGRYQRIPEYSGITGKKPDIGAVTFKLEIPVAMGMTMPLSVTYATAPNLQELKAEKFVRGNFGLTLDFDKLSAILHPPNQQQ